MRWYSKLIPQFRKNKPPAAQAYDNRPYDQNPRDMFFGDYGRMYSENVHVHLAVDMVGMAAACGEFEIVLKGTDTVVDDHPLLDVLENPNPEQSGFEFMESTVDNFQLWGNSYWFMRGNGGAPSEFWPLRPNRVKRIPATFEYVFWLDSERVVYHPLEINHIRAFSATDDFFGDSRLGGARLEISTDYGMARYQNQFFGNNVAVPAGMWLLPEALSNEKYLEAKAEIMEMYGGRRRTAIARASVDGQETKFVAAGLDQEDMSFIDGRKFNRQVILETLGISTGLMSEASTEAHARVAERRFWDGVYYIHRRIAAAVNKNVMPFYGSGMVFRFKDVRLVDKDVLNSASKNQTETRGEGDDQETATDVRAAGVGQGRETLRGDISPFYRAASA